MDFAMSSVSDDRMWRSARMWMYDDLHNAPTCALNVRCLSSVTPRIRTESVTATGVPEMSTCVRSARVCTRWRVPKTIASDLSGFRASPFLLNQSCRSARHLSNLDWTTRRFPADKATYNSASSAYCCWRMEWPDVRAAMGATNRVNKIGPSTETLRHPTRALAWRRTGSSDTDHLAAPWEIGLYPTEWSSGYSEGTGESGEEQLMVDSIECCTQVERHQKRENAMPIDIPSKIYSKDLPKSVEVEFVDRFRCLSWCVRFVYRRHLSNDYQVLWQHFRWRYKQPNMENTIKLLFTTLWYNAGYWVGL